MYSLYFSILCLLSHRELGSLSETLHGYYQKLPEDKERFITKGRYEKLDEIACGILCTHAKEPQCKGIVYNEEEKSCFVKFNEYDLGTDAALENDKKEEPKGLFYKKIL